MKSFALTGPPDEGFCIDGPTGWRLSYWWAHRIKFGSVFSRRVEPPKFYLSKEELANCPDFFQEGLMHRNEKAYYCWTRKIWKMLVRPSWIQKTVSKIRPTIWKCKIWDHPKNAFPYCKTNLYWKSMIFAPKNTFLHRVDFRLSVCNINRSKLYALAPRTFSN